MMPNMDNGGRWHHIASDAEVRRALRDHEAIAIEAPVISVTFLVSRKTLTTLRAGAAGGDVFSVEGGWVYAHDLAQRLDEQELRQVAEVETRA
jgi:hypothetical protein